ncbi:MAG: TolC family protein [Prevotellaceae bacterium]|nr:TolC family protein [Prevotellaceae bacterium]
MKRTLIILLLLSGATVAPALAQEMLTLERCRELALQNNLAAHNANIAVEAARQVEQEAFTKRFPSISVNGTGFQASAPMMSMNMDLSTTIAAVSPVLTWLAPPGTTFDPSLLNRFENLRLEALRNGVVAGITAVQPLYAGGQIATGNRLAKAGVEVSRLQKQMSDREVKLSAERYFWMLTALKEKLKTIDTAAILLDRISSDVKIAVETGLTVRSDMLRVELERNRLESNRFKVENGLAVLKKALALHIGLASDSFDVQPPDWSEIHLPPDDDDSVRLLNRPEYRLLAKSVEVADMLVKMEAGKHLPTVAIGAAYQYVNFDMRQKNSIRNDFGIVFATISIPLSDHWGGSYAVRKKKLERRAAENTRKEKSDLLLLQMQRTRNELKEAYKQVTLARKSISVAEENLRENEDNFRAGITTLSTLLEAQNLLQQARDQHTEAAIEYFLKIMDYEL